MEGYLYVQEKSKMFLYSYSAHNAHAGKAYFYR